ncbi:MAG: membrane dipeptidase, partial [Pseudomonadota bacterium]
MNTEAHLSVSSRAQQLISDSILVDMTAANSPLHPIFKISVGFEPWVEKYRRAGITWASMTVNADFTKNAGDMIKGFAANRRYILEHPQDYILVTSTAAVRRAKIESKLAVNFNFQGSMPLEGDVNLVEPMKTLGVGHMLLTYNDKNLAGGGSHDPDDPGLSPLGRDLVREMNRVGMIVDCTHTSCRSALEICELSSRPVIYSHSSARALRDHARNINDDQIRACAATGGVIGISGVGLFLSEDYNDISAEIIFRHIDYVAALVGHEHVGLGLDYIPGQDDPKPEGHNILAEYTHKYGEDQYPPMNHMAIASPD